MIFLLVYDTTAGNLVSIREFSDQERNGAMRALKEAQEAHLRELEDVEIALFETSSRETLEQTHSRYFKSISELSDSLGAGARRGA
jgi:hypothetical protein